MKLELRRVASAAALAFTIGTAVAGANHVEAHLNQTPAAETDNDLQYLTYSELLKHINAADLQDLRDDLGVILEDDMELHQDQIEFFGTSGQQLRRYMLINRGTTNFFYIYSSDKDNDQSRIITKGQAIVFHKFTPGAALGPAEYPFLYGGLAPAPKPTASPSFTPPLLPTPCPSDLTLKNYCNVDRVIYASAN